MPTRRALVIGAGVSGLAITYRLLRSDWEVVVLDQPTPREPDAVPAALTDFGLDASRRLGLLPALAERRHPRCGLVEVDGAGLPLAVRPKPSPRHPVLGRDDVAAVLNDVIGGAATRRREDFPALVADDCGVTATFARGDADWFDLVVGADEAAAEATNAILPRSQDHQPGWSTVSRRIEVASSCAVSLSLSNRSIRLHPLRDAGSAVSFAWRHVPGTPWPELFADLGWLVPSLLSHVDGVPDGPVHRVRTDRWVHQRVVLIGDAAWHLGPHAERGVSLAIGGAELLGDALDIFPDEEEALCWWERTLRPYVRRAQTRIRGLDDREAPWDSPSTRSANWTR
ncbi:FAD-dependent oxidoreductase [Lentzea sp. NPDC102401]|uniref:FAD-dependent oxidoreductase n=1 Tax=Lentzea sp. NPDC102401 TaxID=3364128 RepID=UPI0037F6D5F8